MSTYNEFESAASGKSSPLGESVLLPQRLAANGFYRNPVYDRSAPDPFVLRHNGEYWLYTTGIVEDGRAFGILHSRDLVHWTEVGGALEQLPGGATCYWAPEVIYLNGRFLMYYSIGNEELMEIRVAIAERPEGPFADSGHRLTRETFAIDPHVFEDEDGNHYLFYATDFMEHTHVGTGTVVDRMIDPFTLAGEPRPVVRACYDWQVYDPQRASKGGVRWHTVEGPFVMKRKGLYYEMFSGGNWQNVSYGVGYAVSSDLGANGEWQQACDGVRVMPILGTIPGRVVGPGHNCAILGPNNREWFCVYHRWSDDNSARILCIDRMDWAGQRLFVIGPTTTPQIPPLPPTVSGFQGGDHPTLGGGWVCSGGTWSVRDGVALQSDAEATAEARHVTETSRFIFEVNLRAVKSERALDNGMAGRFGVGLIHNSTVLLRIMIAEGALVLTTPEGEEDLPLPQGFDPSVFHRLLIELDGRHAALMLDGPGLHWRGHIDSYVDVVTLVTEGTAAEFAGVALTLGWEDLFLEDGDPTGIGWEVRHGGGWHIAGKELWWQTSGGEQGVLTKGMSFETYELVVNARVDGTSGDGRYGFYPAITPNGDGDLLKIERNEWGWELQWHDTSGVAGLALPADFDPTVYHQFRFRKEPGRLFIQLEELPLGHIPAPAGSTRIGLFAERDTVVFDMVRMTVIGRTNGGS